MRDLIKRHARQSKKAIILFKIFDNWRLRRRIVAGEIETIHGSTHLHSSLNESLAYIDKQFTDYLDYSGLTSEWLQERRVLELGPGDNLGVALKFLAAGAESVVCLDRFYSKRDPDHEQEIYTGLRNSLRPEERLRFDEAISFNGGIHLNAKRLNVVYGNTLEGFASELVRDYHSFDLIVSCAVLEEIYDPDPTFVAMDKLLATGGYLVHKIDLTDYGMFRNQGMHPLTFLTIPEGLYKRMASDSGLPNRKRLGYYIDKIKELGYQMKFFVTSTITRGRLEPAAEYSVVSFDSDSDRRVVQEIRSHLASEFKNAEDEELLVDGILMVARKSA